MRKRVLMIMLIVLAALGMVSVSLVFAETFTQTAGQGDIGDEIEQEESKALEAENPASAVEAGTPNANFTLQGQTVLSAPLFIGVDDIDIPAYLVDPATGTAYPQFNGAEVWGAAYDSINERILLSSGATLYEWPLSGTPTRLGTFESSQSGNVLAMVGLAYANGTLYGSRTISSDTDPEGIYEIDPVTLQATAAISYNVASSLTDIGGIDADPTSGTLYGTNDSAGLRGLVQIDTDGTVTLLAPYPDGETDVDGLAVGNDGRAYLVTDQPGSIYVYDFATMTYTTPITNPWTASKLFSAGAWVTDTIVVPPAISLNKTVSAIPNLCTSSDEIEVEAGGEVTYCYEITNTGPITLTLHDLEDSQLGTLLSGVNVELPPGDSATLVQLATVTATTVNTATWTAYNLDPTGAITPTDVVSATDVATVTVAGPPPPTSTLALTKTVGTDLSTCADTAEIAVDAGTEVLYCYEVTNNGTISLTLHDLEDDQLGPILTAFPLDLAPGASTVVTQSAVISETTANTATWTAYNEGPTDMVSATDSANVTVEVSGTAEIAVSPTSLSATVPISGQLTQTLAISNTGTADLEWGVTKGCGVPEDIPWVSASPISGTTAAGGSSIVDVVFDATNLEINVYTGTLCVESNDLNTPQVPVSLTLSVTAAAASPTGPDPGEVTTEQSDPSSRLQTMALVLPFAIVVGAGVRWRKRDRRR